MVTTVEVSVDYFLGIALGRLRLSPQQFFEMRLVHFFLMVNDFFKAEEQRARFTAELFRGQTALLINSSRPEHLQVKPAKLWKFPWDENPEADLLDELQQLSREEFEQTYRSFLGV